MTTITRPSISSVDGTWSAAFDQAVSPIAQVVSFIPGERIFAEGSPSDSFLILDDGEVRVEVRTPEVDTDPVVAYQGAGSILGDVGVMAGGPRSATVYAHTAVTGRRVWSADLAQLYEREPRLGLAVARVLGEQTAAKLVGATERLAAYLIADVSDPEVDEMVSAAAVAQHEFEQWPEDRVDALLLGIAGAVHKRAEELATLNVEETTIGNVPDKVLKIRFAAVGVYARMAGMPGIGVISVNDERGVTEVASPVGVIFGIVPVTNPVSTFVNKALACLKPRNAVILSPHRMAQRTTDLVGEVVRGALEEHGAPPDLVQWVRGRTSRQKTANFMRHPGVGLVLATGGPSMVKAAYSCGKPALGVGAGNAPVWIAPDADTGAAARAVIESKCFDNGLTCGAEQHLVVDRSVIDEFTTSLTENGAAVLDDEQTARLIEHAFDPVTGDLLLQHVGRPATAIAQAVGLDLGDVVRLLVFRADPVRLEGAASHERLAPMLSLFAVDGDDEALRLCASLLAAEGTGHTAVVHTEDPARAERFTAHMPASRVLVGAPASQGCCGVLSGLSPSLTLGCGTFGGNSTTDNVDYTHLRNVKRQARINYSNLLAYNRLAKKL